MKIIDNEDGTQQVEPESVEDKLALAYLKAHIPATEANIYVLNAFVAGYRAGYIDGQIEGERN